MHTASGSSRLVEELPEALIKPRHIGTCLHGPGPGWPNALNHNPSHRRINDAAAARAGWSGNSSRWVPRAAHCEHGPLVHPPPLPACARVPAPRALPLHHHHWRLVLCCSWLVQKLTDLNLRLLPSQWCLRASRARDLEGLVSRSARPATSTSLSPPLRAMP